MSKITRSRSHSVAQLQVQQKANNKPTKEQDTFPADVLASRLYKAMKGGEYFGLGTDEKALFEVLEQKTPEQLKQILRAYSEQYDPTFPKKNPTLQDDAARLKYHFEFLAQHLKGELNSSEKAYAEILLKPLIKEIYKEDKPTDIGTLRKAFLFVKDGSKQSLLEFITKNTPEENVRFMNAARIDLRKVAEANFSGSDLQKTLRALGVNQSNTAQRIAKKTREEAHAAKYERSYQAERSKQQAKLKAEQPHADCDKAVGAIDKAMKQFTVDLDKTEAIIKELNGHDLEAAQTEILYHVDHSSLSKADKAALKSLATNQRLSESERLFHAMKGGRTGIGTNVETVMSIIEGKTKAEIVELKAAYENVHRSILGKPGDLEKDLISELSGRDQFHAKLALDGLPNLNSNEGIVQAYERLANRVNYEIENGKNLWVSAEGIGKEEGAFDRVQRNYQRALEKLATALECETPESWDKARYYLNMVDRDLDSLVGVKKSAVSLATEAGAVVGATIAITAVTIASGGTVTMFVAAGLAGAAGASGSAAWADGHLTGEQFSEALKKGSITGVATVTGMKAGQVATQTVGKGGHLAGPGLAGRTEAGKYVLKSTGFIGKETVEGSVEGGIEGLGEGSFTSAAIGFATGGVLGKTMDLSGQSIKRVLTKGTKATKSIPTRIYDADMPDGWFTTEGTYFKTSNKKVQSYLDNLMEKRPPKGSQGDCMYRCVDAVMMSRGLEPPGSLSIRHGQFEVLGRSNTENLQQKLQNVMKEGETVALSAMGPSQFNKDKTKFYHGFNAVKLDGEVHIFDPQVGAFVVPKKIKMEDGTDFSYIEISRVPDELIEGHGGVKLEDLSSSKVSLDISEKTLRQNSTLNSAHARSKGTIDEAFESDILAREPKRLHLDQSRIQDFINQQVANKSFWSPEFEEHIREYNLYALQHPNRKPLDLTGSKGATVQAKPTQTQASKPASDIPTAVRNTEFEQDMINFDINRLHVYEKSIQRYVDDMIANKELWSPEFERTIKEYNRDALGSPIKRPINLGGGRVNDLVQRKLRPYEIENGVFGIEMDHQSTLNAYKEVWGGQTPPDRFMLNAHSGPGFDGIMLDSKDMLKAMKEHPELKPLYDKYVQPLDPKNPLFDPTEGLFFGPDDTDDLVTIIEHFGFDPEKHKAIDIVACMGSVVHEGSQTLHADFPAALAISSQRATSAHPYILSQDGLTRTYQDTAGQDHILGQQSNNRTVFTGRTSWMYQPSPDDKGTAHRLGDQSMTAEVNMNHDVAPKSAADDLPIEQRGKVSDAAGKVKEDAPAAHKGHKSQLRATIIAHKLPASIYTPRRRERIQRAVYRHTRPRDIRDGLHNNHTTFVDPLSGLNDMSDAVRLKLEGRLDSIASRIEKTWQHMSSKLNHMSQDDIEQRLLLNLNKEGYQVEAVRVSTQQDGDVSRLNFHVAFQESSTLFDYTYQEPMSRYDRNLPDGSVCFKYTNRRSSSSRESLTLESVYPIQFYIE